MNIRNIREIKNLAGERLKDAPQHSKLALTYCGISVGLSALVTLLSYCLSLRIDQTGGLSNIGLRSVLSTIQTLLPMAQGVIVICLELGFLNAMLRISRGQYASLNSLRMGMDRFWPLIRSVLLQSAIYMGLIFVGVYLGAQIFLLTPLSRDAMELMTGMMGGLDPAASIDATLMLDEAAYMAFFNSMLPMIPIAILVCLVLVVPVFYQYRLVNYLLIDNPGMPVLALLRQSRKLMKGNRLALFRLDVSLWWYYLLNLLAAVVGYGDVLLPMAGISLPFSETVGYFLFYGIYLAVQFVILWRFLSRISVIYSLAYQSLLPEKKPDNGVVLGNIFQM